MTEILDPYDAARRSLALADRSERLRVLVTGPDRAKFLHNLTTNDVNGLEVGRGCEAFVTSPQGKTLAFVTLHADADRILLRSDPGALEELQPHLDKYGIFDDIHWTDTTARTYEFHLVGPRASEALGQLNIEPPAGSAWHSHQTVMLLDRAGWLIREAPTGQPGWTLIGDRDDLPLVTDLLRKAGEPLGMVALDATSFEDLRIEAGTPVSGRDVTPENLPQELDRDQQAISFTKGCYLGQETVARIDALGHVNRFLRCLQLDAGPVPPPGTELRAEGKVVGRLTSTAQAPGLGVPIALGYVRRTHAEIGRTLELECEGATRTARIVAPPGRADSA